jgi:hypothetical protein
MDFIRLARIRNSGGVCEPGNEHSGFCIMQESSWHVEQLPSYEKLYSAELARHISFVAVVSFD